MHWPSIDGQPLSEFSTPYLATVAFSCLFPDGLGEPTNPVLLRDIPFYERIKHQIKFAEKNGRKVDLPIWQSSKVSLLVFRYDSEKPNPEAVQYISQAKPR